MTVKCSPPYIPNVDIYERIEIEPTYGLEGGSSTEGLTVQFHDKSGIRNGGNYIRCLKSSPTSDCWGLAKYTGPSLAGARVEVLSNKFLLHWHTSSSEKEGNGSGWEYTVSGAERELSSIGLPIAEMVHDMVSWGPLRPLGTPVASDKNTKDWGEGRRGEVGKVSFMTVEGDEESSKSIEVMVSFPVFNRKGQDGPLEEEEHIIVLDSTGNAIAQQGGKKQKENSFYECTKIIKAPAKALPMDVKPFMDISKDGSDSLWEVYMEALQGEQRRNALKCLSLLITEWLHEVTNFGLDIFGGDAQVFLKVLQLLIRNSNFHLEVHPYLVKKIEAAAASAGENESAKAILVALVDYAVEVLKRTYQKELQKSIVEKVLPLITTGSSPIVKGAPPPSVRSLTLTFGEGEEADEDLQPTLIYLVKHDVIRVLGDTILDRDMELGWELLNALYQEVGQPMGKGDTSLALESIRAKLFSPEVCEVLTQRLKLNQPDLKTIHLSTAYLDAIKLGDDVDAPTVALVGNLKRVTERQWAMESSPSDRPSKTLKALIEALVVGSYVMQKAESSTPRSDQLEKSDSLDSPAPMKLARSPSIQGSPNCALPPLEGVNTLWRFYLALRAITEEDAGLVLPASGLDLSLLNARRMELSDLVDRVNTVAKAKRYEEDKVLSKSYSSLTEDTHGSGKAELFSALQDFNRCVKVIPTIDLDVIGHRWSIANAFGKARAIIFTAVKTSMLKK